MQDNTLNKKARWHHYVLVYFYWFITVVMAFGILFMARTAFRTLLFNIMTTGLQGQAMANLLEKILILVIAVVILCFIIFTEDYFYKAVGQKLLLNRFLRILGIELLVLFVFNTIIFVPSGKEVLLLIPALELVAGVFMMVWSFKK